MMKVIVSALLIACATPAIAEEAQGCAQIEDSLQRLTCFDRLFPRDASAKVPDQSAHSNAEPSDEQWMISEDKSAIDDSLRVTAGLVPKDVSYTGIGNGEAYLIVACRENTTSVIIATNMFMTDDTVQVTTRLGTEQASTARWSRSTDYKAVGLWNGSQAIPFVKKLVDHQTLALRIQSKDRLDAQFDLANVREAVEKVAAACNWQLDP